MGTKVFNSLLPRLWPNPPRDDAFEEIVLLRLGGASFEKTEYVVEAVEAVESCRIGLPAEVPMSVCDRLNDVMLDMTECCVMRQGVSRAEIYTPWDACLRPWL
jgi:hypothetical protein